MSTYTFYYTPIVAGGFKRGQCVVCGKPAERSKRFQQTLNPFNKNADGTVKTVAQIRDEVNAWAMEWQNAPVLHARCEAAS